MAVYTHLSQQQLLQIAQRYGFTTLHSAHGIAEGVENSNYALLGERANGQTVKAILTLFEKRIQPSELPFFIHLMQHLARNGICCPEPLLMTDNTLIGTFAEKHYCMVSFLNGQSIKHPNKDECHQLGNAMARLHLAGIDAPIRRANDLSLAGWQRLSTNLMPQLDTITQGLAETVADELAHISSHWVDDLPRGIIHADLFPDNVFFENGTLSGIIDFYFACDDQFAYDIAISINSWCFDETKRQFDSAKASALIAGYEQVRPLITKERAALPMLLRAAALRFLLTRAHDWIHHDVTAVVTPHDPLEYLHKLSLWQNEGFAL